MLKFFKFNNSKFNKTLILIVVSIIGLYIAFKSLDSFLSSQVKADTVVLIPKDMSSYSVGDILMHHEVINNKVLFFLYAKTINLLKKTHIIAGEYKFDQGMTLSSVVSKITSGDVVIHRITIPEGKNIFEVIDIIKDSYGIVKTNQICQNKTCPRLKSAEGSILPDTYFYQYGITDQEIFKIAKDAMEVFINSAWNDRNKSIDDVIKSKGDAVILASIIEKEANIDDEKPLVASVYINRLRNSMRLQADPTLLYGIELERQRINFLSSEDLNNNSPYNTYQNHGLPPTAICNPGKASILAVLSPANTDFLYFVADGKGGHRFSSQYSGHLDNVKLYRQEESYIKLKKEAQINK